MDMEIKGISCDVKNCKYHDKANNCNAAQLTQNAKHLNAATAAVVAKINQNNGSVNRRAVI